MELFHLKFVVLLLLLLFLELFLINCDAAGRCLEAENSTLLQLKKGFTTGKPESWQPGTDCCIWKGVTCDEYERITGLILSDQLISGTIDHCLFNLTSLQTLSFSYNNFKGIPIPDSGWDRLVNLSSLDLSYVGFAGKVPASISRLTKLTFLSLSCNYKPSLAINPMILQNMSILKELILDNVNVSSYLDEWCGVLVNSTPVLELLSMSNSSLFGAICSSLSMLPFLYVIDFGYNNLDSNIPELFANFSSLSTLNLRNNKFEGCEFYGTIPSSIGNLLELVYLDLSYNNFNGVLGLEFIKDLKNLKYLYISNSGFSLTQLDADIGSSSSSFPMMLHWTLVGCNLTKIPIFIKYQDQMRKLDLSNNKICGKIPSWIWRIGELKQLTSLISSNTTSQSDLSWLSLANNNLTGEIPPFICNITRLSALDLSNNKLTGTVPSCLLEEGIDLSVLNLGGNQLHGAIPQGISPKCDLKIIILKDNQLEGLLPRLMVFIESTATRFGIPTLQFQRNSTSDGGDKMAGAR
ncbi:hypothetical protein M5K25_021997 [Dendrobium thyrsiflorum]|uniref:Leucine-rich repeat-containing N-terminal plant-type domain-containing protein n=1 Tax=Dendrobium thyrsiflorum TaxID=117978 RepID=A0ABD0U5X5_DENTH